MRTSQQGIDLIKEFEGFSKRAYLCPGLVWTIGYGHTKGVKPEDVVTEREAEQLLREDLQDAEGIVDHLVTAKIDQKQFDALVSLVYNIGTGNFHKSTIRRLINEGCWDIKKLEHAWMIWNKSKGKVLKGLVRRREAEFNLFCDCFQNGNSHQQVTTDKGKLNESNAQ